MCGRCADTGGHTVDLQFFKVALKNSRLTDSDKEVMKNTLIQLIKDHKGIYGDIDLFDGNEHNFVEIGGWIGNQGVALELMAMGELLGIWKVITPDGIAPDFSEETRKMLAEAGYILMKYGKKL